MPLRSLAAAAFLLLAGPAQAQNVVEIDLYPDFASNPIHGSFVIDDAIAFADWLLWLEALDGPGSGGPSDIPMDVQILTEALPGQSLQLSDDMFWLADPTWSDQVQYLVHQEPELVEDRVGGSLGGILESRGAPVVDISNGFLVAISNSFLLEISNGF
jgi:hypothetical protein